MIPPQLAALRAPRSRDEAGDLFKKILDQAHGRNRLMAFHVIQALTQSDPVKRVESLDRAIVATEMMAAEFRRARDIYAGHVARLPLPPAPSVNPGIAELISRTPMPARPVPKHF